MTDFTAGNIISTGAARFLNPIHCELANSKDINNVTSNTTISDSDTIIYSDGTAIKKITFANLCAAIATKLDL